MILPDVNVLIHAVNADSPRNDHIRSWLDDSLSGIDPVYLPWVVILGFVRITTNPRLFEHPLSLDDAVSYIQTWLERPPVRTADALPGHWERVSSLLQQAGAAGNLTTDAHLAALAIEHGCVLYSTDTDFARFPGLRWRVP